MQYVPVKKMFTKVCLLVCICLTAFMSTAKAGLDYYKIFLDKKLIYERYVNKPLDLQRLPISAANANETLTVYYFQCNAPGKTGNNRSIALKDDRGKTVKVWNFAKAQGNDAGMSISVKELLHLQQKNKNVSLALYYTAEDRYEGMKLAFVQVAAKDVTYMHQHNDFISPISWFAWIFLFRSIVIV